ncbi:hypothetical protein NA57DRAFT_60553 [Rhizodiscina lignyota]|uniref:Uncharacterized protein n=1 Tax=Rhizodiscina lignyota TaxID=1504668 RepID=A0A9P4I8A4_9PEZI|nr:hypothetical protein NA57DRAFT_60553 [Rhizodiscina lignyota]
MGGDSNVWYCCNCSDGPYNIHVIPCCGNCGHHGCNQCIGEGSSGSYKHYSPQGGTGPIGQSHSPTTKKRRRISPPPSPPSPPPPPNPLGQAAFDSACSKLKELAISSERPRIDDETAHRILDPILNPQGHFEQLEEIEERLPELLGVAGHLNLSDDGTECHRLCSLKTLDECYSRITFLSEALDVLKDAELSNRTFKILVIRVGWVPNQRHRRPICDGIRPKDLSPKAWWPFLDNPYVLPLMGDHQMDYRWAPMLKDRPSLASFVTMSKACLEYEDKDHGDCGICTGHFHYDEMQERCCGESDIKYPKKTRNIFSTTVQIPPSPAPVSLPTPESLPPTPRDPGATAPEATATREPRPLPGTRIQIEEIGILEIRNHSEAPLAQLTTSFLSKVAHRITSRSGTRRVYKELLDPMSVDDPQKMPIFIS